MESWLGLYQLTKWVVQDMCSDCSLVQALKQNGVEKFSPLGDKFDPNMHSALFQIPDAEKEAGTVVIVTKVTSFHCHLEACAAYAYLACSCSVHLAIHVLVRLTQQCRPTNSGVLQSGYSLNGRVVRAAEVGVSTQPQ